MNKVLLSLLLCIIGLIFSLSGLRAEVLKASISDSIGIVGLDMYVGAEPVPIIKNVFPDTPAFKAGLHPNDRIIAINNKKTYGLNSEEVDYAIPDTPGETVSLTVLRDNKLLSFNLKVVPLHLISENTQKAYSQF